MKKPIATPSRTKEILETHGMFAKKNYGQNFLIESGIVDKIARHAVLSDHCGVCAEPLFKRGSGENEGCLSGGGRGSRSPDYGRGGPGHESV